jgi:hypothetical protein
MAAKGPFLAHHSLPGLNNASDILGPSLGAPESFICWSVSDTALGLLAHVDQRGQARLD